MDIIYTHIHAHMGIKYPSMAVLMVSSLIEKRVNGRHQDGGLRKMLVFFYVQPLV
jgi:hypothetical protein